MIGHDDEDRGRHIPYTVHTYKVDFVQIIRTLSISSAQSTHHQQTQRMMAHPTLNHPLPSIPKNQTPNSLPELAHFLSSPTYTDQTHPDKFVRWGKIVLDKVLPLDFGVYSGQNQGQQQQQQDQGRGQDQPTAQTQGDPSPSHPNSIPGSSSNPDSNSIPNTNINSNTSNRDHRCSDLELDILHREAQGVDGPMTHRWGLILWIL